MRTRLAVPALALAAVVAVPASAGPAGAAAPVPSAPTTTRMSTTHPWAPVASPGAAWRPTAPRHGIVSAAGVRQQLACAGKGPVTIVVVPGLGATASSWSGVAADLTRISRTCRYDRPGLGASPRRPRAAQIVDAGLYARELGALLLAAHEPGPYVVIGHSFGGLIAQAFTRDFPKAVAGLLLAESVDARASGSPYWHEAGHAVDMRRSRASARGRLLNGTGPLLVLSASNPERDHLGGPSYGQSGAAIASWRASQRAMTRLTTDSVQVTARSGHVLQQDNPAATVAAVRTLVQAVVSGTPLTCAGSWARYRATCRG